MEKEDLKNEIIKDLENKFKKERRQFGITLVALVVTIIILLIVSGIVISQLVNNGLLDKAKIAKGKHDNAVILENDILTNLAKDNNDGNEEMISTRDNTDSNPVGTVIAYMGATAPTNYLPCDGRVLNVSEYGELFDVLKTADHSSWATADWSTTFSLPNLQGEFLRGTGTNSHANQGSGDSIGKHQDATNIGSDIGYAADVHISESDGNQRTYSGGVYGAANNQTISAAAKNVRPTNTSVLYCIKAK